MEKVSLREVYETVTRNWKTLVYTLLAAILIGISAYVVTPKAYTSNVSLSIEGNKKSLGGLGGLANLAGLSTEAFSPGLDATLYENIVHSTPYLLDVVNQKIYLGGDSVRLKSYISQREVETFGQKLKAVFNDVKSRPVTDPEAPDSVRKGTQDEKRLFRNLRILNVQGEEKRAVAILDKRIEYIVEEEEPVRLQVTLQDPAVSAQVAMLMVEVLSNYVMDYESDRGHQKVGYIEGQLDSARIKLYKAQLRLANAKDRNRNLAASLGEVQLERLNMEYQLAYEVYNSLARQLETSKISLQEEKPVFIVIEPPQLMNADFPSRPRLVIYLIFSVILGFLGGLLLLYTKIFLRRNS